MAFTLLQRKPDSGLGNIRSSPSDPSRNIDWVLMVAQAALAVIGCFTVYSASRTKQADPYLYTSRQIVFTIGAAVLMLVVMSFDYERLKARAAFLYGATLMLLVLVILAGAVSSGARLSFDIGPIKLQPAEFAKVTVLLLLSSFLADGREDEVSYPRFLVGLLIVGIPSGLVILQPDLGTASVLVAMAMGVLLVAGARPKYIALISAMSIATVVAAFLSGVVSSYQIARIRVFFNQDTSDPRLRDYVYQPKKAMEALTTGGLKGKGWLNGPMTNTKGEIPVQWADFPFSAIGEQFGLIGCSVVLGLFAIVLLRIWRTAHLAKDSFGTYLCAGVFTMLLWQVFQNIAMTMGLMPVTGLPMPFISYGGSSAVTFFVLLGLVQNVHMRRYR